MFVANPIDPSFPTIRYLNTLGPASPYPGARAPLDRPRGSRQRSQLAAIAGVVLAGVAFGAGFVGGKSAADPRVAAAPAAH